MNAHTFLHAPPPFDGLEPFGYELMMIDPPWPVEMRSPKGEKKSAAGKYGLLPFPKLYELPVASLAARDCMLFLWGVWPLVLHGGTPKLRYRDHDAAQSPIGKCISAWGFRYVTGGTWFKRTKHGKAHFGPGYRVRSTCEPFFLAIKGSPQHSRRERNLIEGLAREHSRKPENAYAWCERYMPGARKLELFSRQSRKGWDTWGHEAGKFDPVVTLDSTRGQVAT